jgi:hypothetical protein
MTDAKNILADATPRNFRPGGSNRVKQPRLDRQKIVARLVSLVFLAMTAPSSALFAGSIEENSSATTTVAPKEIDTPLPNPYMGWGLWAGPRYFDGRSFTLEYNTSGFGDSAPLFGWVLIDWMWHDLEPKEGQFYWKDLDTVIDYWAARGKQVELRIWITDDPGWDGNPGNEVCPEWIWTAGVKFREYIGEGKAKKREPDYLAPSYHSVYLPKAKTFLKAVAARYDNPKSPVMLWGAMGYGQWGEWHTLWSKYPWPDRDTKHKALSEILAMYAGVFTVRPLSISFCFDNDLPQVTSLEDFVFRQGLELALEKKFVLARHAFIDGFNVWDKLLMQTYWRDHPVWAEGNWSYIDVKKHGTHGDIGENLDVMLDWHSNWGHFYFDADSYKQAMRDDRATIERGLMPGGLGYRLVPTSASWRKHLRAGDLFLLRQTWVNRNVGHLYVRRPLKIYLTDDQGNEKFSEVDAGFDETTWIKDTDYPFISIFHLPKSLAPGVYDLRIALVDEAGHPEISLGIAGGDAQNRYKLGTIQILSARTPGGSTHLGAPPKDQ